MQLLRATTGLPGFDEILEGGLILERSYLLVGGAGTGKTIFSMQWLHEGARVKERCLYITLAESHYDLKRNMASFNWNLDGIEILDLSPWNQKEKPVQEEYHVFAPSEVETRKDWQSICAAIKTFRPQRLVIDSVTQLRFLSTDEYQFRQQILDLVTYLNRNQVTSLLLYEPNEHDREASVGLAVDGIFRLNLNISTHKVIALRNLQVSKYRGSNFLSGYHALRISNNGINIYPHFIEKRAENSSHYGQFITSGIKQLDELLRGGLDVATTTIITGPSGVGKSTLGAHYLLNSCLLRNQKSILLTFEESVSSIMWRCRKLGMPIDAAMADNMIKIVSINPMDVYPDQFMAMIRNYVNNEDFKMVMIDSLRGYQLVMEEGGTLVSYLQNIVTFLNRMQVTTLITNEVEEITGNLRVTEFSVSHLADNLLLMRYAESRGQVIKIIGCLKKRLSNFQPELREIHFTSQGITVSDKLTHMQGILTGTPSFIDSL